MVDERHDPYNPADLPRHHVISFRASATSVETCHLPRRQQVTASLCTGGISRNEFGILDRGRLRRLQLPSTMKEDWVPTDRRTSGDCATCGNCHLYSSRAAGIFRPAPPPQLIFSAILEFPPPYTPPRLCVPLLCLLRPPPCVFPSPPCPPHGTSCVQGPSGWCESQPPSESISTPRHPQRSFCVASSATCGPFCT